MLIALKQKPLPSSAVRWNRPIATGLEKSGSAVPARHFSLARLGNCILSTISFRLTAVYLVLQDSEILFSWNIRPIETKGIIKHKE
jgi:hypothetical protein